MTVKFIQLVSHRGSLFAIDSEGRLWEGFFHGDAPYHQPIWRLLTMPVSESLP